MTLDDLAAEMRRKFTASNGEPVTLTAEEWTVMADAIHLRDALVELTKAPENERTKRKVAALLAKHGRVRGGAA
ncbi:MAG TPA: hypothetical protein VJ816_03190 [Gemmatimonadales bacterium]|nr:hypothetical protein [Gemmatimonadales bacterium]